MGWHPLKNWRGRHRDGLNLALHAVGIPATVAGVVLAVAGYWVAGVAAFVGGYVMQFLGHAMEGNASGEELLLRRVLRRGTARRP